MGESGFQSFPFNTNEVEMKLLEVFKICPLSNTANLDKFWRIFPKLAVQLSKQIKKEYILGILEFFGSRPLHFWKNRIPKRLLLLDFFHHKRTM